MQSTASPANTLSPASDEAIDAGMAEKKSRRYVRHVDDDHGTVSYRPAGILSEIGFVLLGVALTVGAMALWKP